MIGDERFERRSQDREAAIAAREAETSGLAGDTDLGADKADRMAAIASEIAALKTELADLESEWATEQKLVTEIRDLRDILNPPKDKDNDGKDKPAGEASAVPSAPQAAATDPKELRDHGDPKVRRFLTRGAENGNG